MKKKTLALLLSLVLIIGVVTGGTLAWLTDTTDQVVNTFTVGNIDIALTETDADNDDNANANAYKMIPGWDNPKDPYATVTADSEDCYLFVELTETIGNFSYTPSGSQTPVKATFGAYLSYTVDTGADKWIELDAVKYPGVYYKVIEDAEKGDTNKHYVLAGNKVTTNATVTKEMMDALEAAGANANPKLSITAYACQYWKTNGVEFGAENAWKTIKGIS